MKCVWFFRNICRTRAGTPRRGATFPGILSQTQFSHASIDPGSAPPDCAAACAAARGRSDRRGDLRDFCERKSASQLCRETIRLREKRALGTAQDDSARKALVATITRNDRRGRRTFSRARCICNYCAHLARIPIDARSESAGRIDGLPAGRSAARAPQRSLRRRAGVPCPTALPGPAGGGRP
jgi:hypothetical protein